MRYPQTIAAKAAFPTGWAFTDATHEAACSKCGVQPGFYCESKSGRKAQVPHNERMATYSAQIGEDEFKRRHVRQLTPIEQTMASLLAKA